MWHIFWRGYSRLRSGREHWAWMVVVEVRQGTLGGDTRGWGPAGNTGRGWSWLRSGREQEERRRGEETRRGDEERRRGEEEEKEEEEQATDIKSNNPHLAGGEKEMRSTWSTWSTHCKICKCLSSGSTFPGKTQRPPHVNSVQLTRTEGRGQIDRRLHWVP